MTTNARIWLTFSTFQNAFTICNINHSNDINVTVSEMSLELQNNAFIAIVKSDERNSNGNIRNEHKNVKYTTASFDVRRSSLGESTEKEWKYL